MRHVILDNPGLWRRYRSRSLSKKLKDDKETIEASKSAWLKRKNGRNKTVKNFFFKQAARGGPTIRVVAATRSVADDSPCNIS